MFFWVLSLFFLCVRGMIESGGGVSLLKSGGKKKKKKKRRPSPKLFFFIFFLKGLKKTMAKTKDNKSSSLTGLFFVSLFEVGGGGGGVGQGG